MEYIMSYLYLIYKNKKWKTYLFLCLIFISIENYCIPVFDIKKIQNLLYN